ncbi:hypothetical protein HK405_010115 [Cladochytrium tenue]|nr:hypothetical protein HK405_010115 [Cladochytrium tenue]
MSIADADASQTDDADAVAAGLAATNLAGEVRLLAAAGSRPTGSPAHLATVDRIRAALERAVLGSEPAVPLPSTSQPQHPSVTTAAVIDQPRVARESVRFTRWAVDRAAVRLTLSTTAGNVGADNGVAAAEDVPVAAPFPYSGLTPAAGVRGRLVRLRATDSWAAAAGCIAVVEVANPPVRGGLLFSSWPNKDDDSGKGNSGDGGRSNTAASGELHPFVAARIANPVIAATLFAPDLVRARAAGVLAVLACWRQDDLNERDAQDLYLPFTRAYADLPAAWLAGAAARRALAAAATPAPSLLSPWTWTLPPWRRQTPSSTSACLVLPGAIDPAAEAPTLWTSLRGRHRRGATLMLTSHSDGLNAVEENGHAGLVAVLAAATRRATAASRPLFCSLLAVLPGAHLRIPAVSSHGQATAAFLDAHPDLWQPGGRLCVVGAVAIEHLGARTREAAAAAATDPTTATPTLAGLEPQLLYATTPQLAATARRAWAPAEASGTLPPLPVSLAPGPLVMFGEGEPLHQRGVPTLALVSAPSYLLREAAPDTAAADAATVDVAAGEAQLAAFVRAVLDMDLAVEAAAIAAAAAEGGDPADIDAAALRGALGAPRRLGMWERLAAAVEVAVVLARAKLAT